MKQTRKNRPYVIVHILSALDGKISGSFFSLPETTAAGAVYGEKRSEYRCDAVLNGAVTAAEIYADGFLDAPPAADRVYPREDYIASEDYLHFVVVIDTEGKVNWRGNTVRRRGMPESHVIVAVTENVSDGYLAFLRSLGISYVFAGKETLDVTLAMRKLKTVFGIERLLCCGGGVVNWSLLQAGVVDELSLILAPAADGGTGAATVFDRSAYSFENSPVAFGLISVNKLDDDAVWLRYKPKQIIE